MKVKITNVASIRTQEKIKKAFATLLKEKNDLNKVTVTELVKKAEITRSAFYTHYDNIYAVAKDIQDETLEVLINNIQDLHSLEKINNYFDAIYDYLKNNSEIYSLILNSNIPLLFTDSLSIIISKSLYRVLNDKNISDLELNISLFIDGCINIIIKYYRKEINYSLDEINSYMKETFKKLFIN